jgi:hypothetical protein
MAEEQAAMNQQFLQALQAIKQQLQAQANAIAALAAAPAIIDHSTGPSWPSGE